MRLLTAPGYAYLLRGLEQELWFWGQDTQHAVGGRKNLLVQYGFEKYRTLFQPGSSRYRMNWQGRTLELHSYCAGVYDRKGDSFLYIRADNRASVYRGHRPPWPGRYRESLFFQPQWGRIEDEARFHRTARHFLDWIDDYEAWVKCNMGPDYRRDCYRRYHRGWLPPEEALEWFRLYCDTPETAMKRVA